MSKKWKTAISPSEKRELVLQLEGTSARSCERKLAQIAPETKKPREKAKPITETTTLIQFVADRELVGGIEKLKQLLAHSNPEGRMDVLFKKLVQLGLEKWDPNQRIARRQQRAKIPSQKPLPTSEVKSRYIPAAVRDEIWQRDRGQCQYQDLATGKACGSRHGLQLDHTQPFVRGGSHNPANLRLLCRRHNLLAARKVFGDLWMDSKRPQQATFFDMGR